MHPNTYMCIYIYIYMYTDMYVYLYVHSAVLWGCLVEGHGAFCMARSRGREAGEAVQLQHRGRSVGLIFVIMYICKCIYVCIHTSLYIYIGICIPICIHI